jgi:hypothetical protein
MHEFCDGCQRQYKSRNCVGNIAESFQDLGYSKLVRNFFESSHGKGRQDAAGGLLKNQADMAVVRGKAEIRCARDLYNVAEAKLKTTRSHNCKRRIFKYIEEVERNNKSFQPIRGIRAIHRIETLDSKRVLIRNLSCYCESCIAADGVEPCLNLAQVGHSDETVLRISPGPDNDQETDRDDIVEEQTESVADLISKGSIFAVLCNDDQHDFFLLKALSGVEVLSRHETDLWGASFPPSALVIRGLYFTKKQNNILQYKLLKNPPPIVPCESVLYICQESSVKDNLFCLTEEENNNIMECVNLSALTQ